MLLIRYMSIYHLASINHVKKQSIVKQRLGKDLPTLSGFIEPACQICIMRANARKRVDN